MFICERCHKNANCSNGFIERMMVSWEDGALSRLSRIQLRKEEGGVGMGDGNAEYVPDCGCGLPMSRNPHPAAGAIDRMLEVGTVWQCIPCTQKALKGWSERARRAESALQEVRDDIHEMWSMDYAREMDRRFGTRPLDQNVRVDTGSDGA